MDGDGRGGITLIEQPVEEIGRSAMMLLLDRVENAAAPRHRAGRALSGTRLDARAPVLISAAPAAGL